MNTLTWHVCVRRHASFFSPPHIVILPHSAHVAVRKFGEWIRLKIANYLFGFVFSWVYPSLLPYGHPWAVTGTKGDVSGN